MSVSSEEENSDVCSCSSTISTHLIFWSMPSLLFAWASSPLVVFASRHCLGGNHLELELGAWNVNWAGVRVDKLQRVVRAHEDGDDLAFSEFQHKSNM